MNGLGMDAKSQADASATVLTITLQAVIAVSEGLQMKGDDPGTRRKNVAHPDGEKR